MDEREERYLIVLMHSISGELVCEVNRSVNYDTNTTTRGRLLLTPEGSQALTPEGSQALTPEGRQTLTPEGSQVYDKGSLPLTLDGGCLGVRVPHQETSTNLNPKGADTDSS